MILKCKTLPILWSKPEKIADFFKLENLVGNSDSNEFTIFALRVVRSTKAQENLDILSQDFLKNIILSLIYHNHAPNLIILPDALFIMITLIKSVN